MLIQLESTITCPNCGCQTIETMPKDFCQIRYICANCATILRPHKGDCCVYCSYGTAQCPPKQAEVLGIDLDAMNPEA